MDAALPPPPGAAEGAAEGTGSAPPARAAKPRWADLAAEADGGDDAEDADEDAADAGAVLAGACAGPPAATAAAAAAAGGLVMGTGRRRPDASGELADARSRLADAAAALEGIASRAEASPEKLFLRERVNWHRERLALAPSLALAEHVLFCVDDLERRFFAGRA